MKSTSSIPMEASENPMGPWFLIQSCTRFWIPKVHYEIAIIGTTLIKLKLSCDQKKQIIAGNKSQNIKIFNITFNDECVNDFFGKLS